MNARNKTLATACALACMVATTAPAAARQATHHMDMTDASTPRHHGYSANHAKVAPPVSAPAPASHAMHDMHPTAMPEGDVRSDDYSGGYGHGSMPGMDMHDDPALGKLLLDRFEYVHARDGDPAIAVEGEAWYGRNFDKLWLKFEGEHADGHLQDLRTEALWAHAVAPFWDTQLGVRHDFGIGPARTWAALGVEGTAPYWFQTEATLYVGQAGRTAARVAFQYEARFTQRLILQPSLEANFHGRDDPQRGIGSGLSDIEAGFRVRYEIRREFAPYIGAVWQQRFGRSRDFARAQGDQGDLEFVAGVHVWF